MVVKTCPALFSTPPTPPEHTYTLSSNQESLLPTPQSGEGKRQGGAKGLCPTRPHPTLGEPGLAAQLWDHPSASPEEHLSLPLSTQSVDNFIRYRSPKPCLILDIPPEPHHLGTAHWGPLGPAAGTEQIGGPVMRKDIWMDKWMDNE